MNNLLPLIIVCCSIAIAIFCKQLTLKFVKAFRFALRKAPHSVAGGVVFFTLLTLAMELFFGLCIHFPNPIVHDEYAYVLAADTFASGRLTNPTHPLWEHFESFHIIQRPSYQAKYPPGQGAALAIGQVLFGFPIVGAWLAMAAANGAIFWMLCGWVPRRWAVYGGFLSTLNATFLIMWGQSYWGGQVALLGGALLYGAYPRLKKKPQISTSFILGVGLIILANSRPYEGLLAALPIAIALLCWLFGKQRPGWSVAVSRIIIPIVAILIPAFLWMGYYNYRVTGSITTLPYQAWVDQYYPTSMEGLIFSAKKETASKEPPRIIYGYDSAAHQAEPKFELQFTSVKMSLFMKLLRFDITYTGSYVIILICFCGIGALFRKRETLFALLISMLLIVCAVSQNTSGNPHYIAPIGCLLILLQIQCLRYVYQWKRNWRPVGKMLVAITLVLTALSTITMTASYANPNPTTAFHSWATEKQQILKKLADMGGKHLILVKYNRDHNIHQEWVYNRADIDESKVIWARVLEPEKNKKLIDYFKDRSIWIIEVDQPEIRLIPLRNKKNESGLNI
ncbi:hypothetical protein [Gimesia aquarii]|uniref:Glycosyltransferase RgtA/B/C/D-like domain-containing protein n=1 Tax=Gimesia aquarii TaxID=2527964 RepID=A0A517WP59_9PLAN|nr:hypothetical protein [Gimesia aquarii]QDU07035.1 hypothetical protein V202x_03800 [Gimesia aquarii]